MEWLHEFEPQCAARMEQERDNVVDFLALRHFAHGCERVYSPDRWLLTGEAGVFTDPFYSPGSDFIAIGNELITDLIVRDRRGEDVDQRIEQHNHNYLRLFEGFLRLYEGQYTLMGNAQVMTAKAAWDNACYWAIPALLYFQRRIADAPFMASLDLDLRRFFLLHARMQTFLRRWDVLDTSDYGGGYTNVLFVSGTQAPTGGAGRIADGRVDPAREDLGQFQLTRATRACPAAHCGRRSSGTGAYAPDARRSGYTRYFAHSLSRDSRFASITGAGGDHHTDLITNAESLPPKASEVEIPTATRVARPRSQPHLLGTRRRSRCD